MPSFIIRSPRAKYVANRFGAYQILSDINKSILAAGQIASANLVKALVDTGKQAKSGIHWLGMPKRSSAPSEYPTMQSGRYHDSLYSERNSHGFTIGSRGLAKGYENFLEHGTRFMSARPKRMGGAGGPLNSIIVDNDANTRNTLARLPGEQFRV